MVAVDLTARARVLGIETLHADKRSGSVAFLPRRIAVCAQGETGVVYPSTKWTCTGLGAAGNRFGRRGPIYKILQQLIPVNGDGVGTIPIDVLPLQDDGAGAAAAGSITPSGTPTVAAQYRVRGAGQLSNPFVIGLGALATAANLTAACKAIGYSMIQVPDFPAFVGFTYGTVTSSFAGTGNGTIGTFTTTAKPKPGAWLIKCTAAVADAGDFSVTDPDGILVGSTTGMGAKVVAGLGFTLTDGSTNFVVNDTFTVTVPATAVSVTTAWKGVSANDFVLELLDAAGDAVTTPINGITFTLVQPTGGLVNPNIDSAIAQIGTVWVTDVINGLDIEDTVTLDKYQTFGGAPATETTPASGRWGGLVHKPLVVFTGSKISSVGTAIAIPDARKSDCVNSVLPAPGSPTLPCIIAARQVARIAALANNIPSHDYGSQRATGIVPGADSVQWNYPQKDLAVKAGHSTVDVIDTVVSISDVVTFYHPTGEDPPAYSCVVDIVKIQTAIYNLALEFAQPKWDGAALIPDNQPTTEATAKKPRTIKAAIDKILDALGLAAIISDPATSKKNTIVTISASNPKRFDAKVPIYLSGNTNIKSFTLEFAFYLGTPAIAA